MAYLSKLAQSLVPYTAGEQPKNQRLIKLNTNESPYPPSPMVQTAIMEAAEKLRLYPDAGAGELRQALSRVFGVPEDCLFCGNGSDEVLAFAFAAFFAGKTLLAPDITYSFYPVYAQLFQVRYQTVPLRDDFTIDTEGLMQGCPVVLANPNAPTGILLSKEKIRLLAAHTLKHGEVLLVDEAYAAFSPENCQDLLGEFPNLLIVRTLSKSHGLAGLRVGYAMGDPALIQALCLVRDSFNSYPLDRLAQAGAAAAVLDTDYNEAVADKVCQARDWTLQTLEEAGIAVLPSATNFLFVKADRQDAAAVQQALREEGILVRHFTSPRLKPWLRISIGTMEQMRTVAASLIRLIPREARG